MESASNSGNDEENRFLDTQDDILDDSLSIQDNSSRSSFSHAITPSANLRRRKSVTGRALKYLDSDSGLSLSSSLFWKSKLVEKSEETFRDCGNIEENVDVTQSTEENGDVFHPIEDRMDTSQEQGKDSSVIQSCGEHAESIGENGRDLNVIDSDWIRVDPFLVDTSPIDVKTEESTVLTVNGDRNSESAEAVAAVPSTDKSDEVADSADSGRIRVEPVQVRNIMNYRGGNSPESAAFMAAAPEELSLTVWSFFALIVGTVTETIEFQANLVIKLITFLPWLCYSFSPFVLEPFGTMRLTQHKITWWVAEICDKTLGNISTSKSILLKDPKTMLEFAYNFARGLIWAIYVAIVLITLLISAFVFGGFMISRIAEEPLAIKENLTFDYTKNSPEAYVPLISCNDNCNAKENIEKANRFIMQSRKMEIDVSLTLPESEYNKHLGMFQIRVDFVSEDGRTLYSSRRPCMLRFRSDPLRFIQTLFKIGPLVSGYAHESQTLNRNFKGLLDQKDIPIACIKVIIEQRAEFRPGAGVPELYDASMVISCKLPLVKRIIWSWRKTLLVWISFSVFISELLLTLVCFRPLIIPRARHGDRTRTSVHDANPGRRRVRIKENYEICF